MATVPPSSGHSKPPNSGLMSAAIILMVVNGAFSLLGLLALGAMLLFASTANLALSEDGRVSGTDFFFEGDQREGLRSPATQLDLHFDGGRGAIPDAVGWLFGGALFMMVVVSLVSTMLYLLCAYWLYERRHFLACVVIAAISCLSFPLGTVAGVLALVALFQEGEREVFEHNRLMSGYGRRYRYHH